MPHRTSGLALSIATALVFALSLFGAPTRTAAQITNLATFGAGDRQLSVGVGFIADDRIASIELKNGAVSSTFRFGRDKWSSLYDLWNKALTAQSGSWKQIGVIPPLSIEAGTFGVNLLLTDSTVSYTLRRNELDRFDDVLRQIASFLSVPVTARVHNAPPKAARPKTSSGSGFFITREGHVLTNAHVTEGCTEVRIRTLDGTTALASVVNHNIADDLAILKNSATPRQTAVLRSTPPPRAGEAVITYGFPLSGLLSSTGNATTGSISALGGLGDDSRHLQISAPVQPGNSGGPLVDMSGNVIGVVFSKLDALRVARVTEDIPQNINFAIKASVVMNFLDAHGVSYGIGQLGKELSAPEVVELARSFSVEVRCRR